MSMRRWTVLVTALALVGAIGCSSDRRSTGASAASSAGASTSSGSTNTASNGTALGASSKNPCGVSGASAGDVTHVMWIWMENHNAGDVLSNPDAPFENQLKDECGSSTTYESVGSPSLPNYIGATAGDTFGIHDDAAPTAHRLTADNLFRQARTAGLESKSYEDAMDSPCSLAGSGTYAVKHNPAAYFFGGDDHKACTHDNVALGTINSGPLSDDLRLDALPEFSFITPDLCNDTHDCPVATGDKFLAELVPAILDSATYRSGSLVVFIVWDEPTPMPLLVIAPSVKPGTTASTPFSHYSLLRTTEEILGFPLLAKANDAASMRAAYGI